MAAAAAAAARQRATSAVERRPPSHTSAQPAASMARRFLVVGLPSLARLLLSRLLHCRHESYDKTRARARETACWSLVGSAELALSRFAQQTGSACLKIKTMGDANRQANNKPPPSLAAVGHFLMCAALAMAPAKANCASCRLQPNEKVFWAAICFPLGRQSGQQTLKILFAFRFFSYVQTVVKIELGDRLE